MPDIAAPAGVMLDTTLRRIWENTANPARRAVVRIRLNNVDGAADATLNRCVFRDADPASDVHLLPVGTIIEKGDGIEFDQVCEPGDGIWGAASAPDDVQAVVNVFWEPA